MSGRQRIVLALGLLASCGPPKRECGCKDLRSDPSVCAEETLCSFTKGTEHPGDGTDPVTIDDAEDSARIDTGQLREPAFFEECMASDDASGCIFSYADESTVHSAACS